MFFGPFHVKNEIRTELLTDVDKREFGMLISLALMVLIFGIFPQILLDYINPFAQNFSDTIFESIRFIQNP